MSRYILALDQGTTSSRAMLFDHAGRICGSAQREFRQIYPRPGWVEHDADEIWMSQLEVARQALHAAGGGAADIAAIGIANQRETTVLWDRRSGAPIAHAIVWQDRRTADMCAALDTEGHAGLIQRKTGLVLDAYFSATKLTWLLDNVPGARRRAESGELAFGTVDSWLAFKLTGMHVTDVSNAARTMLFNIHTLRWDEALLELFRVPASILPKIVASSGPIGFSHADLFGRPLLVASLAGDQQAAAVGQACLHPGTAKNTYGTGCFMLLNTGTCSVLSRHRLLSTVGCSLNGPPASAPTYLLEGSVFMAGATIQWLRDGLQMIGSASESEALASAVADTLGVMLVPAFAGLGAPHWDAYARGTLVGMTRGTMRSHIVRAALESIAFQSADVLQAMQADAGIALSELRVDGGAASNNFLMQFQADILGIPVVRPTITETTALGAAHLAGLGSGFWMSMEELTAHWKVERCFEPDFSESKRGELLERWHSAVATAKMWRNCND